MGVILDVGIHAEHSFGLLSSSLDGISVRVHEVEDEKTFQTAECWKEDAAISYIAFTQWNFQACLCYRAYFN